MDKDVINLLKNSADMLEVSYAKFKAELEQLF